MAVHDGGPPDGTSPHRLVDQLAHSRCQELRRLVGFVPFIVAWPIGLMRWSRVVDRVTTSMRPPQPDPSRVERQFTEQEYLLGERISDRLVGLWLLTITGAAAAGGALSALTGLDAGGAALIVMVPSVGLFLRWSSKRTRGLPPQRQAVRPVRVRWLLKACAGVLGVLTLGLVVVMAVGALVKTLK